MSGWGDELARPNRRLDAYVESELAPCGVAGMLQAHRWAPFSEDGADVSDCLVVRYRPWLLTIWEPLLTNAPSPALARPFCCYLNTVIFYDAGYRRQLYGQAWRDSQGKLHRSEPVFYQHDQIETRLRNEQPVTVDFDGEIFTVGCGRVMWAAHGRDRRRWWMRHSARRNDPRRP